MMPVSDCFVSVVAPVHNNSEIIEGFIKEVMVVLESNYTNYELVIIDDDSNDDTVSKITNLLKRYKCMRLIRLSREFGYEIAISAGLDAAIGDFVVVMIPNTDPPNLIPTIVKISRSGNGVVIGTRSKRSGDSLVIKIGTYIFHWYCSRVLNLTIPKNATHFCALTRQAVNAVMQTKDRNRFMRILSSHIGFKTESFNYDQINRDGKLKKIRFLDALNKAISMIVQTSTHPLRFVSWFGIAASLINLLYTCFVIYSYFLGDNIAEGWTTLSLQTSAMFLFVFLILTVLTEYIGHLIVESENRPLYYVLEERNSSNLIVDFDRKNVVTDSVLDEDTIRIIQSDRQQTNKTI